MTSTLTIILSTFGLVQIHVDLMWHDPLHKIDQFEPLHFPAFFLKKLCVHLERIIDSRVSYARIIKDEAIEMHLS